MVSTEPSNNFSNYKKVIELSENDWRSAKTGKICEINATVIDRNYLADQYGRKFHHFCTTSYLGLDYNEKILEGGLFLYLDDSHALSAFGDKGRGFIRPRLPELDDQTLIVASLGKSFGASGGLIMFGSSEQKSLMYRYGGPSNWSQSLNSAAIGAGLASIKIHHSNELLMLQDKLRTNIRLFDSLIYTDQQSSLSAIRLVTCGKAEKANALAIQLADSGFFTSAVFFPVVPSGKAAIRITLRADMTHETIRSFCSKLLALIEENKITN
ncbi:Putative 8-amino-7-oxononanoate synthase [Pseudomonas sp. R4-34-07]|uniref:aminotransferase class I/II-fold pyridoxal phosphate-dependent enzyme n=1 Tax=Pseudomonas sp. R4-34-07 TaxID=658642 RepID=UPI000F58E173|nr:aminotransferase class I/II-fold pyridoxal phosphate-dependent enzyme [Pseudomonas sp. R4-34-07]AZF51846.1 Putative 8-amino-7-oxononanoate synthase [Pseudomonas sp. R4-34-07]